MARLLKLLSTLFTLVALASNHNREPHTLQNNDDDGLIPFRMTYNYRDVTYTINGHEPSGGGPHPVYIFAPGVYINLTDVDSIAHVFTREMARRGYVAAVAELPGTVPVQSNPLITQATANTLYALSCTGSDVALDALVERVWSETSTGPLSTVCRREAADCSAGVALHGVSLGAFHIQLAARYTKLITATLVFSAGNFLTGGDTCCGVLSGNRSCCTEAQTANHVIGGTSLDCFTDEALTRHLPRSRRRIIITHSDRFYGDCSQDPTPECTPDSHAESYGAVAQCIRSSGMEAGGSCTGGECIRADGSGFYAPTEEEVNVDGRCHPDGADGREAVGHHFYCCDDGAWLGHCPISQAFVETEAPWGLRPSFDWLARTARRPL